MADALTLRWIGPWTQEELASHRRKLEGERGVYLWIWSGTPPRVIYVGKATNLWRRINDENRDRRNRAYFNQFAVPEETPDFFLFYKQYRHDGNRCLAGIWAGQVADERRRGLASKSFSYLRFAFATVPASVRLEDVEESLRASVVRLFGSVTGSSLSSGDMIPGAVSTRHTPITLRHEGLNDVPHLFG